MSTSAESPDELIELLSAYALDALEPAERMQVQRLLVEQPELQQILAELRAAADLLPYALERPSLPPEWRQRTLDYALGRRSSVSPSPAVDRQRRQAWRGWQSGLIAVLCVIVLIAAGVIGGLATQLAATRQQRDQAEAQLATVQTTSQQLVALLTSQSPLATLIGETGRGVVVRDETGQLVMITVLPPLPANQVYQLWLLEGSAAPVSGGVFTIEPSGYGIIRLPDTGAQPGTILAITAEPSPGSPAPTSAILISGQLT